MGSSRAACVHVCVRAGTAGIGLYLYFLRALAYLMFIVGGIAMVAVVNNRTQVGFAWACGHSC